jgi:hypothetical protein
MATRGKAWILLSEGDMRRVHHVELDTAGTAEQAWAVARRRFTLDALDRVKTVAAIRVSDMQAVQVVQP